jgi:tetrahydromethanopterin S-methyltransferase subunit G
MSEDLTKQVPCDDLRSILARLDRIEDKADILNHDILKGRADTLDLDERITKLEGEPAP